MAQPRVSVHDDDRLSSLPDGVLSHILSFLPTTEESVRTRVLSTRWNHLFSLVPTLKFYYTCSDSSPPRTTYSQPKKRIKRFLNFVDWVFASYNAGHMLHFSFTSLEFLPKTSPLLSWISQSVRHGVQELIIDVWLPKPLKFPQCIFTSDTITWLKLYGATNNNIILDVPQDVCLPRVKRIELVYVSFLDTDSARRLFRSCPVLEWLCLNSAYTGDIYTLDISVPTLKDFTLFSGDEGDLNLVLDVPNLKHFCYYGLAGIGQGSFSIRGLKLLSVANIIFLTHSSEGYKALEHLLNVICQVKKLHLWHFTLESFQRSGRSFPLFCNLTTLEIEDISLVDPEVLLDLLDRTPHLETLKVNNGGISESGHHIHFPGERVPTCVSLHLKEVTFDYFGMLETEFKMVEYLLKNAKILKTFKISYCGSQEKEVEIRKKLLAFSRWSRDCQIELKQDMGHRLGIF